MAGDLLSLKNPPWVAENALRVNSIPGPRYFDAVVDVVDDPEPAFAAWVAVSEHTVEIHAFDITLGSWQMSDISAALVDDAIVIEVPGSTLRVQAQAPDELLNCLTDSAIGAA